MIDSGIIPSARPVVRWRSAKPSGMPSFAQRASARFAAVQRPRVRKEYKEP